MKKITALLLLTATIARAAPLIAPDGIWHDQPPARIETEIGVATVSPAALVADFGWREPTAQEIADKAAAEAAAQAEAEAQASLPAVFQNGIAVLDEASHHIEFSPTGDGLPVLGWQVSDSPLEKAKRDAMKAERKAAHDALKAAAKDKKLNDKGKIALLMKAVFGAEE